MPPPRVGPASPPGLSRRSPRGCISVGDVAKYSKGRVGDGHVGDVAKAMQARGRCGFCGLRINEGVVRTY